MKYEKAVMPGRVGEKTSTRFVQMLYANLLWYAFLALVASLTYLATGRVWDDVLGDAIRFLFLILGGGFTFASLLDMLYERYYSTKGAVEKP